MTRRGDDTISDDIDRDFVWQLCQRGSVEVLSHQVTVRGRSISLAGLKIPEGCEVEYVYAKRTVDQDNPEVHITFNWLLKKDDR